MPGPALSPRRQATWEALRGLVFTSLALIITLGPYLRQVRHMDIPWLGQWVMFVGYGIDICDVRYFEQHPDGTREELDRYALLDQNSGSPTRGMKYIGSRDAADRLGKRLCKALDKPDPDVRLWARCATRAGWRRQDSWKRNLCTLIPEKSSPSLDGLPIVAPSEP